jgi:hypothetical protein
MIQAYELLLKKLAKKVNVEGREFTKELLEETINEIIDDVYKPLQ